MSFLILINIQIIHKGMGTTHPFFRPFMKGEQS
ncbi:MAG: hypothetical protein H6Q13_1698 [Bacteroidetes bacterium]|nr:hypothetical protein [Bacteroidota bacterium]